VGLLDRVGWDEGGVIVGVVVAAVVADAVDGDGEDTR
jgi:hypothetical protein